MNKFYFFFLLAALLLTGRSHGQDSRFNLSTHVNLNKNTGGIGILSEDVSIVEEKGITLIPRAVFRVNKVWAFGAVYHYNKIDQKLQQIIHIPGSNGPIPIYIGINGKTVYQCAGVLVQSYLYDNGKITAFLELDGTKGTSKTETMIPDGYVNSNPAIKRDVYSSGLHAGGRYRFFKGFGVEARLNGLIQYSQLKAKETIQKHTQFDLFNNFWNNCSLGVSYQF